MGWPNALLLVAAVAGQAAPLPPPFPRPGTTVLLENDVVAVWNVSWLKQQYPLHTHRYDLVGVSYAEGDRIITQGTRPGRLVTTKAWVFQTNRANVTHVEEGASDPPMRAVLIEVKPPAPRGPAAEPTDGLRQVAGPEEVYERPEDLTVARFMGANLIAAHVLGDNRIDIDDGAGTLTLASPATPGPVHLAIVPEQVQITENQLGENTLRAHLISAQYCGGEYRLQLRIGAGQTIEARSKIAPAHHVVFVRLPAETIHVIQKSPPAESVATADPLSRTAVTTKLQEEFA